MLGKRSPAVIGKISDMLVSSHRTAFVDITTSPRSPLELKIQSPRGLKNYDLGGVGLAIVAALEKSNHSNGHEVLAKYAVCSQNLNRSEPIPVHSAKNSARFRGGFEDLETEMESLEDYTFVTCHKPNKSITRVYCDGGRRSISSTFDFDKRCKKKVGVFTISPAIFAEDNIPAAFPTTDFLSSCHLCSKNLHGKDIYMYRGEKAFCSGECRQRQIMMDERKEQCRSEASRSVDVTNSAYTRGQMLLTGILAI